MSYLISSITGFPLVDIDTLICPLDFFDNVTRYLRSVGSVLFLLVDTLGNRMAKEIVNNCQFSLSR